MTDMLNQKDEFGGKKNVLYLTVVGGAMAMWRGLCTGGYVAGILRWFRHTLSYQMM